METKRIVVPGAEEVVDRYFPVLDYGFVALKEYMGGDILIEQAARNSYGQGTRQVADTEKLLRYLMRHEHTSPFEFVEFVFHIGMPIFVMRQFVRHRTCSMNEYSGRYSLMPMLFYTPPTLRKQSKSNKQGSDGVLYPEEEEVFKNRLHESRVDSELLYKAMIDADVSRELARIDLPLSMYTYAYWKMDLKNLLHLIKLRVDPHAQEEIRAYGEVFGAIVKKVCPIAFNAFVEYILDSVKFTRKELRALRSIIINDHIDQEHLLDVYNIKGRERDEFLAKLHAKNLPSFELDPSSATTFEYYDNLAREHAVT